MNARHSAIFSAALALSCGGAESSPLAEQGATKQNKPQPPWASAGQGGDSASATPQSQASVAAAAAAMSGNAGPAPAASSSSGGSGVMPKAAAESGTTADITYDAGFGDDAGPENDAASGKSLCPDGFPRGPVSTEARKLLALKPSPEGVTVCPNGEVFLSLDDGRIVRVALDDPSAETWTTLTGIEPAGISCDEHNQLFVAIYAVRSGSGKPGVMRIEGRSAQGVVLPAPDEASPLAAYNGVLAIAGQGVYATDSGAGWIVRTHETTAGAYTTEIVARDIPIANGLAYDTARHKLYVASSLDFAVYAYDLAADGTLENRSKVPTTSGSFFDGVAVDENGEVYAADYSGNNLVRLSDAKVITTLPTPASLAFRGSTLLISDYRLNQPEAEGGLYAFDLGACSGQRLN